jgi:hypothetical protein
MTWLAWRHSRTRILVAVGLLAALASALLATGSGLERLYTDSGLASCHTADGCPALVNRFMTRMRAHGLYSLLYFLGSAALILAPALFGAFWGAPLLTREIEDDTLKLAWSQSVTRTRWTLVSLVLAGGAAIAVTGLLSLVVGWWAAPIDRAGGFPVSTSRLSRFSPQIFDARGVAPLGYAAFAFALGFTVGVLVRRTVPAMAVTLAGFAIVQFAVPEWIRPHLFAPQHLTSDTLDTTALSGFVMNSAGNLTLPAHLPGAWIVANQTITPSGAQFALPQVPACQTGTYQLCLDWLGDQHLRQLVTYQPADRFWEFQSVETVGYVIAALLLAWFCTWWIRRGEAL